MRTLVALTIMLFLVKSGRAQQLLRHVTSATNTQGHVTTLNHPQLNDKPNAIILLTQQYGVYNPNETGVWYSAGRWKIFNQNRKAMPERTMFNILILDPASCPNAFVHSTSAANTSGHVTTLSSALTDGKENAMVFVTQRYGRYNTSPVGVWYSGGKWRLYNEDRKPLPANTQFNVLVVDNGALPATLRNLKGQAFSHQVDKGSLQKFATKHVTYLNSPLTNNRKDLMLFTTQRFKSTYNTSVTGVWYDAPSWTVFNEDRKALPEKVVFNVLALESAASNVVLAYNLRNVRTVATKPVNEEKNKWKAASRINRTGLYVLPYNDNKANEPAKPDESSSEMLGPNVSLGKDIGTFFNDQGFNQFLGKLNLFRELYEDKNPKSGYFYYLPKNYNLKWNREGSEYSFYIYYLSAEGDARGDVIITAELTPNINRDDIALAEKLLSKKLGKEVKLRPLPLKDTPKVSFGSSLTNFDVKNESIQTNIPSDFLEPIIVSWKMERRVDDFIGAMMNNIGLNGNIEFQPLDEVEKVISVPVRLKINDPQTFGKIEYREASALLNGFVNPVDYPVQLKELVVLRNKSAQDYSIESIPLNNYEVEPQKVFSSFNQSEKDALLNGNVISRMWLEYSLKPCTSCNETVQNKILGGTSDSRVKNIELNVLTPLEFAGASSMKLIIRSKQGDPKGTSEVMLPIITITKDNQTLSGGELFIPEGRQPEYAYQLVLIQPDGSTLPSEWIDGKELFIVLGENAIRSNFKTEEQASEEQPLDSDETSN